MFELDRNRLARIEQHLIVLPDRLILVVLDLLADRDHPAGDDGNLVTVGQDDAGAGLALVVILANDDALADGLDDVEFGAGFGGFDGHCRRIVAGETIRFPCDGRTSVAMRIYALQTSASSLI